MCPGLDFLTNPDDQELWIKVYDEGYEILSTQPSDSCSTAPGRAWARQHNHAKV